MEKGTAGTGRAKRNYPKEFKAKAVAYAEAHPEETYAKLGRRLGITDSTLIRWVNSARAERHKQELQDAKRAVEGDEVGESEREAEGGAEIVVVDSEPIVLPSLARSLAVQEHVRMREVIERARGLLRDIEATSADTATAEEMASVVAGLKAHYQEVEELIDSSAYTEPEL